MQSLSRLQTPDVKEFTSIVQITIDPATDAQLSETFNIGNNLLLGIQIANPSACVAGTVYTLQTSYTDFATPTFADFGDIYDNVLTFNPNASVKKITTDDAMSLPNIRISGSVAETTIIKFNLLIRLK